jgi:hypothetical protein
MWLNVQELFIVTKKIQKRLLYLSLYMHIYLSIVYIFMYVYIYLYIYLSIIYLLSIFLSTYHLSIYHLSCSIYFSIYFPCTHHLWPNYVDFQTCIKYHKLKYGRSQGRWRWKGRWGEILKLGEIRERRPIKQHIKKFKERELYHEV